MSASERRLGRRRGVHVRILRGTRLRFTFVSVVLTCGLSALPIAVAEPPQNLARGCSYTMTPRPNYPLTTDAGDDRQLTDGVYTSSDPIWLRPSTVGWENASPVTVVIDLRRDQSISGVSYSTAAGAADVQWPRSIFVLVS